MIPDDVADVLIPAHGEMPSASAAGANREWLERVLSARPDLRPELERILRSLTGEEAAIAVERLQDARPADLEILFTALAGAYFMSSLVRERIGYAGQRAVRLDTATAEAQLQDEMALTRPVLERGPIYRCVP